MSSNKKTLLLPILLLMIGAGWLLTALEIVPNLDWAWSLGLAAVGILAFVIGGVDKNTVVVGPMFLLGSILSILRQLDKLQLEVELPILVIAAGVLLLISRSDNIPAPRYAADESTEVDPQE